MLTRCLWAFCLFSRVFSSEIIQLNTIVQKYSIKNFDLDTLNSSDFDYFTPSSGIPFLSESSLEDDSLCLNNDLDVDNKAYIKEIYIRKKHGLNKIPIEFSQFKYLEELTVEIDTQKFDFSNLKYFHSPIALNIVGPSIVETTIDLKDVNWKNLFVISELNIQGRSIINIGESINSLKNLEVLTLTTPFIKDAFVSNECFSSILQLHSLKKLKIRTMKIDSIPDAIKNLTNLEFLSLSYCNISMVSPEIGNLDKLVVLDLKKNNIHKLPVTCRHLSSLVVLNVEYNKMNEIPFWVHKLTHLEEFEAGGNNIMYVPPEIIEMVHIKDIGLNSNKIRFLEFNNIASNSIKTMHFHNNPISKFYMRNSSFESLIHFTINDDLLDSLSKMNAAKIMKIVNTNHMPTFDPNKESINDRLRKSILKRLSKAH